MSEEQRDEVLAWMASTGRGYRAASKHFAVPKSTIQAWKQAADRGESIKPRAHARARTPAPARDVAPTPKPAEPDDAFDPATCTDREFLEEYLRRAVRNEDAALEQGHGGVARQWAETALRVRGRLAELTKADADRLADEAKRQQVDPEELVGRVIALAPVLARVAPERTRSLIAALTAALPRS